MNEVTSCPITGDTERFTYINLGDMPLVNNLCDTMDESFKCDTYPLAVQYFTKSKLSCLTHNIDPDLVFSHYSYKSGVIKPYAEHCREMFDFLNDYAKLHIPGITVLDIGGNDGTLLKEFLGLNPKLDVLNVDASENLTEVSFVENHIPTLNAYWGVETAKQLNRKFKLITSTNVFQHTPPIKDYVEAVAMSLDTNGLWCLEFPYWKESMETKQYDQIYHEHVYYYLVEPLKLLFDQYGLDIIKIVKQPIHGGSLRLLIAKKEDKWPICGSVDDHIYFEQYLTSDYYKGWGTDVQLYMDTCWEFLAELKSEGNNIVGFGAAAKGCVFLNSVGIDNLTLDVVIDDTDLKQDKYIPGTGIQIKSREYLKNHKVDYILILAHNFKDAIMESLKDEYNGKFIIMFPTIQIL